MRHRAALGLAVLAAALVASTPVRTQTPTPKPVLYVVATSHLDSQWNWTVQDSIRRFVPATFRENFDRFDRFPSYVFSYEGAIHYMWFKEYFPDEWARLQRYVAQDRWRVAGNWINAVDVNVPSPESLMRHALYAKRFFRSEFGKVGTDVYLPDCFGFGFALPSIARHSGLNAFTTQKLTWGSSYGIPFPVGRWKGVDGSEVVAALNPGAYVTQIDSDISVDPKWSNDATPLGNGKSVVYRLFGVGDIGGAPQPSSIEWLEKALANKNGAVEVRNVSVDQLARDLSAQELAALPVYEGELTMKTHGVGTHTSQAAMKLLNRTNERLADAAERASVLAELVTGLEYPGARLREAWTRVLWHHFHDDITGTSIPQAYQFSWNDEFVSLNQFAGVLTSAASHVASALDTRATGIPIVVYNPLSASRHDPVEATVQFGAAAPAAIHVFDPAAGLYVPSQILERDGRTARILFLPDLPAVGFKVFDVRSATPGATTTTVLSVTPTSLSNARHTVTIDANGDISSVVDREARHELLASPIRLEMRDDPSPDKPAWRILYETVSAPVREYPAKPVIRVVERGPVRVAVEITRQAGPSTIVQRVMLTAGGDRVDVTNDIDWKSTNTLLKAAFPMAASNPKATYDLGLGTIQRGNNHPDAYEVPAQWWADITDTTGTFGAAVLSDSKYGWDKPSDRVLRLTLLHTPKAGAWPRPFYQASQDLGRHHFTYSLAGHAGDWRDGGVPMRAARLNQPPIAFQTTPHDGGTRVLSLASLGDTSGQVAVRALKKAEDSAEIVIRVQELYGRNARTRISFRSAVVSAREINAAEEPVGPFATSGALDVALTPYQPRTFAVRLMSGASSNVDRASAGVLQFGPAPAATRVPLFFNVDGISLDARRADGDFDGRGQTIAGELWPSDLTIDGIPFQLGSSLAGAKNVLVPSGDAITLPRSPGNRIYVLAAAVGGDVTAAFGFASAAGPTHAVRTTVREWQAPIGQWYSTLKTERMLQQVIVPDIPRQTWGERAIADDMVTTFDPATGAVGGIDQIRQAFVKTDEIAWVGTHRHEPGGNQIYVPSYVFMYGFDVPAGATTFTLPSDPRLRIFAITAVRESSSVRPAGALYTPAIPRR
jgi:alpha-mannosidase